MVNRSNYFWNFLKGERFRYAAAFVAVMPAAWLELQVPLVLGLALDRIVGAEVASRSAPMGLLSRLAGDRLFVYGVALILLALGGGFFLFLKGRLAAAAAEGAAEKARNKIYAHIQALPYATLNNIDAGDLIQRAGSDIETARSFFATQLVEVGRTAALIVIAVVSMASLSLRLTVVSVLLVPLIALFAWYFFLRIENAFSRADVAEAELSHTVQEHLAGIRVVRAFGRQPEEMRSFEKRNTTHRDESMRVLRLLAAYWSVSETLSLLQLGLVLIVGTRAVVAGEISAGTLVVFLSYVGLLLWPIRQIGRVLAEMGKALVAVRRIGDIFSMSRERETGSLECRIRGRIEYRNVSLRYEGEAEALRDINLSIAPGETVAILGKTGSGKSSMVQLLARLYEPTDGEILLDGINLKQYSLKYLRSKVGIILQEPFLYRRSLKENVTLAAPHSPQPVLEEAARQAALHTVVKEFEYGWETPVGEGGVTLSGGQKQRVAIARMLLRDPPVLIFDDSLSAVDSRTDRKIRNALRSRHSVFTTIVISHRLSTLMEADRIIVIEEGRITQNGRHETLLGEEGLYREMWNLQNSMQDELGGGRHDSP